jgi:hypothetical protein
MPTGERRRSSYRDSNYYGDVNHHKRTEGNQASLHAARVVDRP